MPGTRETLKGLLVVSLEQAVAAPYCSSRLADCGARVIKVERRDGDFARSYDKAVNGLSTYFVWLNRGKQSLCADIKSEADQLLLRNILRKADIFIQNLAPGAAVRAGLGGEALRSDNPKLITVDITGYGKANSYSDMKAYDLLVQAESGLAGITGHPAGPGRVGVSVCDIACGMYAHAAVLEALIARGQTGLGCHIDVSLFDGMAEWMNVPLLYLEGLGVAPERMGLAHPSICPYGAFSLRSGELVLVSIQHEREWQAFCAHVLQDAALAAAPGFDCNTSRVANRGAVDARVASSFAEMERGEATGRLKTAGTAFGFVNDLNGLRNHPALRRITVDTPAGPASLVAPPAMFDNADAGYGAVPSIDQHGAAIRAEFGSSG